MADITFLHLGGVGANTRLAVMVDGEHRATIERGRLISGGANGFAITDRFQHRVGWGATLSLAREKATALDHQALGDQYEAACERVRLLRTADLERRFASRIADLARQTLDGRNQARCDLADLLAEIDRVAADRDRTTEGGPFRDEHCAGERCSSLRRYPRPLEAR